MLEFTREMWLLVLIGSVLALFLLRSGLRGAIVGKPNIALVELDGFFREKDGIEILTNHSRQEPGIKSVQLLDQAVSVIYSWSPHAETIDVCVPGKAGFFLTYRDGKVVRLSRVGGNEYRFPRLSIPEDRAVKRLLERIRAVIADAKQHRDDIP